MNQNQFTLLVGDDLDENMISIGPFETIEAAVAYAEIECRDETWRIARLYSVRAIIPPRAKNAAA